MSVPVFPYSNVESFQFTLCSANDSFDQHFIFLMRFWSFPYFHMRLLLLIKTFKGQLRSVPVFPYSNIVYFKFCSYSFNDSFVRHFIFLMRFWSFPYFHMKLLLLIKTFKGRLMSVPVFPYSNIGFFFFFLNSVHVHLNDTFDRHFIFLMRFWSFLDFHMKLSAFGKVFKGRKSYPVFPYSNIVCFQFCSILLHRIFSIQFIFILMILSTDISYF